MPTRSWSVDLLIQGYPGSTTFHGGLGWSTVTLLRSGDEAVVVDTGGYMQRDLLTGRLHDHGLDRSDVTAVLLTHCHSDHMVNWPLFPRARVVVSGADLDWAVRQPVGFWFVPELHVAELARHPHLQRVTDGDDVVDGIRVLATPGHTPGHVAYVVETASGSVVLCGDAVKNLAELASGRVEMTLDPAASKDSVSRIRDLAAADPETLVVCGHDRTLAVIGDEVVPRTELRAEVVARLTEDPFDTTVFDLGTQ